MKLLACASYDFMKLMVVELQHQITEIESGGSSKAEGSGVGGEPRPPPRTRHNPFNTGKEKHKYTWLDWHTGYGERILQDREEWLEQRRRTEQERSHQIEMSGDNLLIVL